MLKSIKPLYLLLSLVTWLLLTVALYMVFFFAPTEQSMGHIQRIFYFHVPSAWTAFLSFFIVCVSGILYLKSRCFKWDYLAHAAAEIGVLFITLVLLSGPLWARPVWNTWWTWDARLTTSFVLWLLYISYLLLRRFIEEPQRRAQFAAVFGIVGFLDVPLVYMSIRWWRTLHPGAVIGGGEDSGLHPHMLITLLVSLVAFTMLFITLVLLRSRTLRMGDKAEALIWKTSLESQ
ncbi:MAG: cytochrome c biogenesis protein CcsA [candidate division KSB1 bacterium]|nr:cytochrome c biogenesis protein CcsA [candidate division KSB1 bacterium]